MFPEDRMMEVLIIGALALIVIGPKDLPIAMRKLGRFIGKLRGMAAEFRASFDELARQSELDELRKEVDALRASRESVVSSINPLADGHVASTFGEINEQLGQVSFSPPMSSQIDAEREAAEAVTAIEPPPTAEAEAPPPVMEAKPKAPRKPRAKPATSKTAKTSAKATGAAS